jgi:hypothetical protein
MTEWGVQRSPITGREAVEGDRQVMYSESGHGTEGIADVDVVHMGRA